MRYVLQNNIQYSKKLSFIIKDFFYLFIKYSFLLLMLSKLFLSLNKFNPLNYRFFKLFKNDNTFYFYLFTFLFLLKKNKKKLIYSSYYYYLQNNPLNSFFNKFFIYRFKTQSLYFISNKNYIFKYIYIFFFFLNFIKKINLYRLGNLNINYNIYISHLKWIHRTYFKLFSY